MKALALWILGGIVLLLALVCLLRVGVRARLRDGVLTVQIGVGPFHFRIPSEKKQKETPMPENIKKPGKKRTPARRNLPLRDLRSAAAVLWPAGKRALRRFGRGVRVHPLQGSVVIGGSQDAAAAAERYGLAHAAVWTGMPVLESLVRIPAPGIHIGLDFDRPETVAEGDVGVSLRIGTLLALGFGLVVPAVKWLITWKNGRSSPESASGASPAA